MPCPVVHGACGVQVYNEFIIDGVTWNKGLPGTIDAFMMGQIGSEGAKQASAHHKAFLDKFGLTADDVPLLEVTGSATKAFRVAVVP